MSEADILAQWWAEMPRLLAHTAAWWRLANDAVSEGRITQAELDRIMGAGP